MGDPYVVIKWENDQKIGMERVKKAYEVFFGRGGLHGVWFYSNLVPKLLIYEKS
jgi:hypothetical protein